jgi:hypothetical protein
MATDVISTILNDVENQVRDIAQNASTQSTSNGRPTQAELAALQAITKGKETASDDSTDLEIHSFLHRAWAMQVERNGWSLNEISPDHIRALRLAESALRLIPKREPIA